MNLLGLLGLQGLKENLLRHNNDYNPSYGVILHKKLESLNVYYAGVLRRRKERTEPTIPNLAYRRSCLQHPGRFTKQQGTPHIPCVGRWLVVTTPDMGTRDSRMPPTGNRTPVAHPLTSNYNE